MSVQIDEALDLAEQMALARHRRLYGDQQLDTASRLIAEAKRYTATCIADGMLSAEVGTDRLSRYQPLLPRS
jgi:hypothetical protein